MNTMLDHKSVNDQLKQIIAPNGKSYYDIQLRKSRVTAFILALTTIVSLLFMMFAFVQKAAADTAMQEAHKNMILAQEAKAHQIHLENELTKCKASQSNPDTLTP